MGQSAIENFKDERERLNDIVMKYAGTPIKRFYSLDSQVYRDGALPAKTKELLGLVASLVLRCDDCITYHLLQCHEGGLSDHELEEALTIGLVVGGSITIPHLRRAFAAWDELKKSNRSDFSGENIRQKNCLLTEPGGKVDMENRSELYDRLTGKVKEIVELPSDRDDKLLTICTLLREHFFHYDWIGFYLVDPKNGKELILGPYVGEPTEHVRIPFGKGICGQAAEREETFVIQDVSQETNYLSCSSKVQSEIVVPIFKMGAVVGELDIDSHTISPFTEEERNFLEQVCVIVSDLF